MPEDAIAREKLLRMGVFVGFQEGWQSKPPLL
jgi:hypothetical protein